MPLPGWRGARSGENSNKMTRLPVGFRGDLRLCTGRRDDRDPASSEAGPPRSDTPRGFSRRGNRPGWSRDLHPLRTPMTKLSDTQLILLTAAALRADGNLLPLPGSLQGPAATRVVAALLARGLAEERIVGSAAAGRPRAEFSLAHSRRRTRRPAADHKGRSRRPRDRGRPRSRDGRWGPRPSAAWTKGGSDAGSALQAAASAPSERGHQAGAADRDAPPQRGRHHRSDRRCDRLAAAHGARRLRRGAEEAARPLDRSPRRSRVAAGSTDRLAERGRTLDAVERNGARGPRVMARGSTGCSGERIMHHTFFPHPRRFVGRAALGPNATLARAPR